MRKLLFLLIAILFIFRPCQATDHNEEDLLSLLSLTTESATPAKLTAMFGQPLKIEEGRKRTKWFYENGAVKMVIWWNKKSALLEKFSFMSEDKGKGVFDNSMSYKLKSGTTDIEQAFKLLGTPKDMILKEFTQEMHYAYQNNVLRLFFRDRKLVDYCLY